MVQLVVTLCWAHMAMHLPFVVNYSLARRNKAIKVRHVADQLSAQQTDDYTYRPTHI